MLPLHNNSNNSVTGRRCSPWRHSPCSVPEKWHFDITDTLIVRFTYLLTVSY